MLAVMAELRALDIVRDCTAPSCEGPYALGRQIMKRCVRIDEAPHQPRARDAIDLWTMPRDPLARHHAQLAVSRKTLRPPLLNTAFKEIRAYSRLLKETCGDIWAWLYAVLTIKNDGTVFGHLPSPQVSFVRLEADRANDKNIGLGEGALATHVDENRGVGCSKT